MAHILCKLVGHREFTDEVLTLRPWEDREFRRYPISAFRERNCLRCNENLTA